MPLLENDAIRLNNVRLSFPSLRAPKASTAGGALKYRATFLMEPGSEAGTELQQLIQKVAVDKWGPEGAAIAMQMIAQDKKLRCYGQGDTKISGKTGKPYEGYPGMLYVDTMNDLPVGLFDAEGQPLDNMTIGALFQGGDWVDGLARIWAQDNTHGKAIRCELVGVKFVKEGPHFGADRMDPGSVFGAPKPQQPADAPATEGAAPAAGINLFG